MNRKLKRRNFLTLSARVAVGALATACGVAQPPKNGTQEPSAISNGLLQVVLTRTKGLGRTGTFISAVEVMTDRGWRQILGGEGGAEFATTLGGMNASTAEVHQSADGGWIATLSGKAQGWEAIETITLRPGEAVLRREQTYRFSRQVEAAICPGFTLQADPQLRYTFPLRAWEKPFAGLKPLRAAVDWALPLPFHVWHDQDLVVVYGLDKSTSPGTLDFIPPDSSGKAQVRVYFPDTAKQAEEMSAPDFGRPAIPDLATFTARTEVTLVEIIAARPLSAGQEPLLEAERIAAGILMKTPPHPADLPAVAQGIRDYYQHCELWEPDAFGPGRGWFTNMWVRTQTGPAKKRGEMSGYFDFGWGEGIAVEILQGAVRFWKRTNDASLLPYVDEITRNFDFYKRADGDDQPYFDRSDGVHFGDFMMDIIPGQRVWSHSLGHTGSQLLQLYLAAPDYPSQETRQAWRSAAESMARFFARQQKEDGDLQDIFDENDREVNTKPHRITARASVCGLWAYLGQITGDEAWTERALRLAKVVAPEINRFEYYNQMIDTIGAPGVEFSDGEAAYYVLEGLVPLYAATRAPEILALCQKAAAFGIAWTYFFDVPKANKGIARGGQCCRMPDFPLLYPIGPAKAMTPFLDLYDLTRDPLFEQMAAETAAFIGNWQMLDPGKPWDGGMIHAIGQYSGKHWGPDLAGQIDTGMATGNGLAAVEKWLEYRSVGGSEFEKAHQLSPGCSQRAITGPGGRPSAARQG